VGWGTCSECGKKGMMMKQYLNRYYHSRCLQALINSIEEEKEAEYLKRREAKKAAEERAEKEAKWRKMAAVEKELIAYDAYVEQRIEAAEKKAKRAAAAKKAAATRKKKAAEEKAEYDMRIERSDSLVKAGIPTTIVDAWVDKKITKETMFLIFKTFETTEWLKENLVNHILTIVAENNISYFREMSIPEMISQIYTILSTGGEEMFVFLVNENLSGEEIDFLIECQMEFFPLYLAIVQGEIIELNFAIKLIKDYGFENQQEALKEVIEGADWEAVAVKYGFFQI